MASPKAPNVKDMAESLTAMSNKKPKGLGFVWSESTNAIGEIASGIGSLATAGKVVAHNAKRQAALSSLESAKEMCEVMGVEAQGIDALTFSDALTDYICNR